MRDQLLSLLLALVLGAAAAAVADDVDTGPLATGHPADSPCSGHCSGRSNADAGQRLREELQGRLRSLQNSFADPQTSAITNPRITSLHGAKPTPEAQLQLPLASAAPAPAPSGRRPCSEACYQRATCNDELGRCDCPKHLSGTDCQSPTSPTYLRYFTQSPEAEAVAPLPCLNQCNGRGACSLGECVCQRGYFGADCSLSIASSGKPVILDGKDYQPREQRPYIYVYDIPHRHSSWHNPRRSDREAHWTIWSRLLGARVLVADGDQADWFFIPVKMRNNADGPKLLKAIEYIRQNWPWYDRLGGHRHFVIHTGDSGRGEVAEEVRQTSANITWLHHFGLYEDFLYSGWKAAHRPGQDIVIPVVFKAKTSKELLAASPLHPRAPHLARDRTFLFAGRICGDGRPPLTDPHRTWPHCHTNKSMGYSQGARQLVHFHHHTRPDFKIVTSSHTYLLDLMRHKWCLAPSGGGHGHRQTLTAAMGCLPVVISDLVMQPFEPEMDWAAFSLRLKLNEVPELHDKLSAVDERMYDLMQAAVQCAAQHLLYSSSKGAIMQEDGRWDAFETVLEILRMQQLHPGLDPSHYRNRDERFRRFMGCGFDDMVQAGEARRLEGAAKFSVPLEEQLYGGQNSRSGGGGDGSGGSLLTWEMMHSSKGLPALLKHAAGTSKGPKGNRDSARGGSGGAGEIEGGASGALALCSVSKWDLMTRRCGCPGYSDCFEPGLQVE